MNWKLIPVYDRMIEENRKVFTRYEYTFVFWVLAFVSVGLAAMCGILRPEDGDFSYIILVYMMLNLAQMSMWQRTNFTIVEKSRSRTEISKLMFAPVDLRMYFVTKVYRMIKYYMIYACCMQVFTLFIHLASHGWRFEFMYETWMPLIAGVIAVVCNAAMLWIVYRDDMKQV